jgi:two-component system sensor histidine kinase/response regulator
MDWNLPDMSGPDATKAIRRAWSAPGPLPIICMTGHALREHDAAWSAAGMDGLLAKPFRIGDLRRILARWMPAPSAGRGNTGGVVQDGYE